MEIFRDYSARNTNNITKYTICSLAVKFYNSLPLSVRDLPTKTFKILVKSTLTDNPLYNLDEFLKYIDGTFFYLTYMTSPYIFMSKA